MIKEAIAFVEKFESDQTEQKSREDWKDKKFVIVNTKQDGEGIVYDSFESLDNDDSIKSWINKNTHYSPIFENLNSYILPNAINKAIGSTSGLGTYCFFAFRLSQKNLERFQEKIKKTQFSDDKDEKIKIKEIHGILTEISPQLTQKTDDGFKYKDYYIVINTRIEQFNEWRLLTDEFINMRTSAGRSNQKAVKGICVSCKDEKNLKWPLFLTNYDGEKKFLLHKTRISEDEQGTPLLVCSECIHKLNDFEKILKNNKIKIFPLFINPDEVTEEIKIIKSDSEKDSNTFAFIFEELKLRIKKGIFDFYLVVMSGNYFSFDYVTEYKWQLGDYTEFFWEERNTHLINRQVFEIKVCNALIGCSWINYFDDKIKGSDNQQISLIYSVRQKLFDFVYRNQNTFSVRDLANIVIFRTEKEIKNGSANRTKCREYLRLYFNKHLLEGNKMDKEKILLNKVKSMKDAIVLGNFDKFEIRDDDEWAYWAGQIAYYLVSLSKSKDKNYGLLEPFTNKSTTMLVKITIKELFEKYKHAINLSNQKFRNIISKVLAYEINKPFMDLKIPFYVGAFDNNAIYTKKEEKQVEVE